MKFKLGSRLMVLRNPVQVFKLPTVATWGLTNKANDNMFLLYLDYDNCEYSVVLDDIESLQKKFNIGACITRISSLKNYKKEKVGSYHVFSFFKHTFPDVQKLLQHARCDDHFKRGWMYQQRCWVLRIGEKTSPYTGAIVKPSTSFRELILQKHDGRQKVAYKGLLEFFEQLDNIKLKKYFRRLDDSTVSDVELIKYPTRG